MKNSEDFTNRKETRRKNLKSKNIKKERELDSFDVPQSEVRKEIKKKKQTLDDDEWEDWERYYNH
jgi:hypothetical protein